MPDIYWAEVQAVGLQLRFDERQVLSTIFCYVDGREGFNAVALDTIGVSIFKSFDLVEQACKRDGAKYRMSAQGKMWLKVLGISHDTHYQFDDDQLTMVTLMLPSR